MRYLFLTLFLFLSGAFLFADEFKDAVENDWIRQEKTAGRTIDSQDALTALISRTEALLQSLQDDEAISEEGSAALSNAIAQASAGDLQTLSADEIRARYLMLRWKNREAAFSNPLIQGKPIAFLKADRYVWQLIHEYLSYYYSQTSMCGGELMILKNPGFSFETESLTEGKLPRGVFETPNLSYDAKTLYFAFADFTNVVPEGKEPETLKVLMKRGRDNEIEEYMKRTEGKFHLYKMDLASGEITQLTEGEDDDFDPFELPDGDLVFISTRRGGFARCTATYEPVEDATLHLRKKDGTIQPLSWHETNEWNPSVLQDGRIVYTRWDYVDREAARYMNLWVTNPDGTGAQALFGNYTEKIVSMLGAKQIPNSNKIMFLGSGHHIAVGGVVGILDPTKVAYDPVTAQDTMDCIEVITPEIPFPETPAEPGKQGNSHDGRFNCCSEHYYYSPWPLSENYYLTSYSHDPNGGYLATHGYGINDIHYSGVVGEPFSSGKMGLYYLDRYGNKELMYEDEKVSCRHPMQIQPREKPPVIASKLPSVPSSEGTFVLSNVYESLIPFPKDRPVKELRIFELFSHEPDYPADHPKLGTNFAANARALLGTVPVEEDGSAHFKAPAGKRLYFQAVDANGKAIQTMLSEVYLMPGENRGCVGCHEQNQTASKNVPIQGKALTRPASELVPGPDGSRPWSFTRLIQPILEERCVSCHNGKEGSVKPDLTSTFSEDYTKGYDGLVEYVRIYRWGNSIRPIVSFPGESPTDMSELTKILEDENHGDRIGLTDAQRWNFYLWMDANAPFYGTGVPEDRERQRRGEIVPCPVR